MLAQRDEFHGFVHLALQRGRIDDSHHDIRGERPSGRFELQRLLSHLLRERPVGQQRRTEEIEGVRRLHLGDEDIFQERLLRDDRDTERTLARRVELQVHRGQHVAADLTAQLFARGFERAPRGGQ